MGGFPGRRTDSGGVLRQGTARGRGNLYKGMGEVPIRIPYRVLRNGIHHDGKGGSGFMAHASLLGAEDVGPLYSAR